MESIHNASGVCLFRVRNTVRLFIEHLACTVQDLQQQSCSYDPSHIDDTPDDERQQLILDERDDCTSRGAFILQPFTLAAIVFEREREREREKERERERERER